MCLLDCLRCNPIGPGVTRSGCRLGVAVEGVQVVRLEGRRLRVDVSPESGGDA